jgi:hypothetical protein
MKPDQGKAIAQERFKFVGTMIPCICYDCIHNEGRNCSAWGKDRGDISLRDYICNKTCPQYEKEIEEQKKR